MSKNLKNTVQNKPTPTESGRSMVEMLGVLAVVGVLSIGGIAGYQYAMNKHKANTILYTVSEMAATGAGQLLAGNDLTLNEFGTHIDGIYEFGFNGDYSGTETDFSIIVYDIPQAVCQHIQEAEFTMPYLRLMNDSDNGSCDEGMNTAEFVFRDNLGHDNSNRQELANGCSANRPIMTSNGSCVECPELQFSGYEMSFAAADASYCTKCNYGSDFVFEYIDGHCKLMAQNGVCPAGTFLWDSNRCQACDSTGYLHTDDRDRLNACVEACDGKRVIIGNKCRKVCDGEGEFYDSWGHCEKCATTTHYWGDCSNSPCPGKTFSQYNYYDDCVINCGAEGYGSNVGRCCDDNETYTHIGESNYGHPYGSCCPNSRPNWDGSKCVP